MTPQRHPHKLYPRAVAWAAAAALVLTGCSASDDAAGPSRAPTVVSETSSPVDSATTSPVDSATTSSPATTATPSDDTAEPSRPAAVATKTSAPPPSATASPPDVATPTATSAATGEVQASPSTPAATREVQTSPPAAPETSATTSDAEPEPEPVAAPASGSAAGALDAEVVVYDAPSGTATRTFANPTASGVPLTFMVTSTADEWVQVQLPVRPNGSTGWVRSQDVTVFDVDYVLKVSTADNTLDVYFDGALIHSFSVATGTGETPTPLGTYYLTELIAPTNSGYGPYAYGISAFSEVLNEFLGGPGQIGLHGTNDSGSIGQAVSHGCIRLSNADITTLVALLPLGTPIQITG